MTLFQSLAYSAGFDPSMGPGNPCDSGGSGSCVLPWGSGTKSVSSIVLIANGVSFAVSSQHNFRRSILTFRSGNDFDFHYNRIGSRLRDIWTMATARSHRFLLDFPIC